MYFPTLIKFILVSNSLSEVLVLGNCGGIAGYVLWLASRYLTLIRGNNNFLLY